MEPRLSTWQLWLLLALLSVAQTGFAKKAKPKAPNAETKKSDSLDLSYIKGRQMALDGNFEEALPLLEKALKTSPDDPYLNFQLSEIHLRLSNFERAESLAKKAVEKEADNVGYRANLAGILAALKKYDEAKAQYEKILELEPRNRRASLFLGIIEAERGNLDEGIHILGEAIDKDEDNYMAYFYRAKIHLEKNDAESAQEDLDRCLTLRPSFEEAGTALGLLYERSGDTEKAIATYNRIQGNGRFKKRLAQLYLQKNKFKKALQELLEYEKVELDDYTARVKIALIYFELKKYDEARRRFTKILKEQPGADVRFYLAAIYEEKGEKEKALAEFKKVGADSTFFKESMLHVGFILREQKKYNEGEKFARGLIKKYPKIPDFYDMRASFFEQQKKFDQALSALSDGLKRFPEDEKLLYFQGALFDKVGKREKAVENMQRIVEKNEKNAHALNFLGYTYAEMGVKLDKAEELIKKALKLRPNDGFIEDSLAWVYFKKGDFDEAQELLEKALTRQPNEAVILEHLGDVYLAQEEFEKALDSYTKALAASKKSKNKELQAKIETKLTELKKDKRLPSNDK